MAIAAERNRLARDLHDAVTQTLFSASLIADVLPRIWERDQEQGRAATGGTAGIDTGRFGRNAHAAVGTASGHAD